MRTGVAIICAIYAVIFAVIAGTLKIDTEGSTSRQRIDCLNKCSDFSDKELSATTLLQHHRHVLVDLYYQDVLVGSGG